MSGTIAVVLKGYPRLSETFIAQELLELELEGFKLALFSMRMPTDKRRHPINDEIRATVRYLPEYLYQEPMRVLRGWWKARRMPGYRKALRSWLGDLRRDFTSNRGRRFGQALVLAAEMPADIRWIYSHFIHTPGSVGRYASELTGLPWSVSAHAKDIWTSPDWELSEKLDAARWTVTCTAGGAAHLAALAPEPERVRLVYHGLDLSRFPRPASQGSARTGGEPDDPVRILSVGRAVAKKGLDTLADALALLPSDLHWRWTHIGGGELADTLRTQIAGLGLADRVEIHGSRPQAEILAAYRAADLFALPCRIAASGDRDGLPNVIVEAGSQNLAVISTPISGIPELIEDGRNGILVPPDDVRALADALLRLARDPVMRDALGQALGETVHGKFSHRRTIGALVALLDQSGVRERTGAIAS